MIRQIENAIKAFQEQIDTRAHSIEKAKNEIRKDTRFTESCKNDECEKQDNNLKEFSKGVSGGAVEVLNLYLSRGRNYIYAAVANVNIESIQKIEALRGLELSDYEKNVIKDQLTGDYWGIRKFIDVQTTAENPVKAVLDCFGIQVPTPQYYIDIFKQIENDLTECINNYRGPLTLTDAKEPQDIKAATLLNGTYFDDMIERLNVNPTFFTEDMADALTITEDAFLNQNFGTCKDYEVESKVIEFANISLKHRDMIVRSKYAYILQKHEKTAAENAAVDAYLNGDTLTGEQLQRLADFGKRTGCFNK